MNKLHLMNVMLQIEKVKSIDGKDIVIDDIVFTSVQEFVYFLVWF